MLNDPDIASERVRGMKKAGNKKWWQKKKEG
jgi:hypothetical protein